MVYKDYLNAARKHQLTCKVLHEKLQEIDSKRNRAEYKSILLNLYYLSGYIIECIVKYGIYDIRDYNRNKDIKYLDEKDGPKYKFHINQHKFERYTEYLNKEIGGIPLINKQDNIDKEVVYLYKNWDADIRYSYELKKEEKYYIEFYNYANKIFETIRINLRS